MIMTTIASNLHTVQARLAAACQAAGRPVDSVTLLAVSKTFAADAVAEALVAGQRCFGENYIQEAVEKIQAIANVDLQWHCIGPIQSNKTRLVAEHFDWVQSVDRLRIAQRLNDQRPDGLAPLQVCIQVNMDGGATKSGAAPDDVPELAQQIAALPRLRLRGLMSIPEPVADFEACRAQHARTRALFDALNARGLGLDTLSMGMSADLEAAVHAGSTMVRVGTAIFGHRTYAAT